jgi:hypothetical protein
MKLSFKKHKKETGLRAVGHPYTSVDIKLGGKRLGMISAPSWQTPDNKWSIMLMIKREATPDWPASWTWTTLKARFDEEEQARAFVSENIEKIKDKFDLYLSKE